MERVMDPIKDPGEAMGIRGLARTQQTMAAPVDHQTEVPMKTQATVWPARMIKVQIDLRLRIKITVLMILEMIQ
jgi:hypothetical protein